MRAEGFSIAVLALALAAGVPAAGRQAPPAFRLATRLVPIDVRVLDAAGRPVEGLAPADFVVTEDNVSQTVRHFSLQALEPEPGSAEPLATVRSLGPAPAVGPQRFRVFLLVLGRGRLQAPARGVDGMIDLVRRLLPQDRVAVMAWNRATEFTTDHAAIGRVLEAFRAEHERIEAGLVQEFHGLAALYGTGAIPARLQGAIDGVLRAGAVDTRITLPGSMPGGAGLAADERRIVDALQTAMVNETRAPGRFLTDAVDQAEALGLGGMTLDDFAGLRNQSMQDIRLITAGVQYLRHIAGEKHLVFVTQSGVFLPRAEQDRDLAALASDARVVIDVLHTGGAQSPGDWRRGTSRTVAEETGGTVSLTRNASDFVRRLDVATRFQYVLGYYPTDNRLDGRFRRIAVRVRRPGLTVHYRRGYFATADRPPMDRQRAFTYARVGEAASQAEAGGDLALTAAARQVTLPTKAREVRVELRIAPERLAIFERDGRHVGAIDVAIFCRGARNDLVATSWNEVLMEMTPDAHQRFLKNGVTYTQTLPIRAAVDVREVRIVVYDYAVDRVGSAFVKIR
jgi:VWFA-related protein